MQAKLGGQLTSRIRQRRFLQSFAEPPNVGLIQI